jgi:hypothetical protein
MSDKRQELVQLFREASLVGAGYSEALANRALVLLAKPGRTLRVVVESPYGSDDPAEVKANEHYLDDCLAYVLEQGAAPYASHGLYTRPGVLDDRVPEERRRGIEAGFVWGAVADEVWVFLDRGVSRGMLYGIRRAVEAKQPIRYVHFVPHERIDGEVEAGERTTTLLSWLAKLEAEEARYPNPGEVWHNSNGRKVVVPKSPERLERMRDELLDDPAAWSFVCDKPHDDGDFSYTCGSGYCRCCS